MHCLHSCQRVKRGHERQIQFVLELMPRQPRKPIVGVNHLGTGVRANMVAHRIGELGNDVDQLFFWQVDITSPHMHESMVWLDFHDVGQAALPRTCVGGALHTETRQRRGEFAHIHIHAAAITDAGLGQR